MRALALVAAVGAEDGEHPALSVGSPALRLQRRHNFKRLQRRLPLALAKPWPCSLSATGREPDARRLIELSHTDCSQLVVAVVY